MFKLAKGQKPSAKDSGHKTPPKGYPENEGSYADPTNYKYPIDTEKHCRAALSYLNKPENQKEYSEAELSYMFNRIYARAKHFKIDLNEKKEEYLDKKSYNQALIRTIGDSMEMLREQNHFKEANTLEAILIKLAYGANTNE